MAGGCRGQGAAAAPAAGREGLAPWPVVAGRRLAGLCIRQVPAAVRIRPHVFCNCSLCRSATVYKVLFRGEAVAAKVSVAPSVAGRHQLWARLSFAPCKQHLQGVAASWPPMYQAAHRPAVSTLPCGRRWRSAATWPTSGHSLQKRSGYMRCGTHTLCRCTASACRAARYVELQAVEVDTGCRVAVGQHTQAHAWAVAHAMLSSLLCVCTPSCCCCCCRASYCWSSAPAATCTQRWL